MTVCKEKYNSNNNNNNNNNNLKMKPDLNTVIEKTKKGNCIPVYCTKFSDMVTPVAAYMKLGLGKKHI